MASQSPSKASSTRSESFGRLRRQRSPIWVSISGPEGLAVTGRLADGWIPPHAADWRSATVAKGWPIVRQAAVAARRNPHEVGIAYLVAGRITPDPVPTAQTRDETGRWAGGGVRQWVEELTYAVLEAHACAFNYLVPPGAPSLDEVTLRRWTDEVVPAVKETLRAHQP